MKFDGVYAKSNTELSNALNLFVVLVLCCNCTDQVVSGFSVSNCGIDTQHITPLVSMHLNGNMSLYVYLSSHGINIAVMFFNKFVGKYTDIGVISEG